MDDLDISLPSGEGDGSEEEESEKDKPGTSSSEGEGDESDSSDSDSELNSFEKEVKDAMDKMKEENESKSDESSDDKKENDSKSTSSDGMEGGFGNVFGDRNDMVSGPRSLTDDNFREREEEIAEMSDNVRIPLYLNFPKK